MRIKSIITATALLLMSSCKEQSRTLIFALDYSKALELIGYLKWTRSYQLLNKVIR